MSAAVSSDAKAAFIEAAIASGVLLFGSFTLKSGRQSPYFLNAGKLYDGQLLATTADSFAATLLNSRIPKFDTLFGPAYKGIPLAAVTTVALAQRGVKSEYTYNRKEKKDHGEGGSLVGAPLEGKRIVIIDDVMTSGKAIREAIDIIALEPTAKLVGIVQLVDRQERGKGPEGKSTIQEVESEFGIPVVPIINVIDILAYLKAKGGYENVIVAIEEYRKEYGIVE